MSQFDLMMVLEYFDYSLALISLQFCIPPEDLLYIAVNQRHDHSEKPPFKEENLVRLKELNWPDFLYYEGELYKYHTFLNIEFFLKFLTRCFSKNIFYLKNM